MKQEELLLECPHCGSTHLAKQKLLFDDEKGRDEITVCLDCGRDLDE